jgi:hypothetical protein
MSEKTEAKVESKPKREPKPKEQVAIVAEPDVRLGSLAIHSPREMIAQATEMATVLADVIHSQKLYTVIKGKKYVLCEGWTTLAAMLGITPVEEYCRLLQNGKGFEAKINLIRGRDGAVIGGASAECTTDEKLWEKRDSYSLRSMALTRATGKACRLTFSWIMKLAGFQPTPAEEMYGEEDASALKNLVEAEVERQKAEKTLLNGPDKQQTLFYVEPEQFNRHRAVFVNLKGYRAALTEPAQEGLKLILKKYLKGKGDEIWVATGSREGELDALLIELAEAGVVTRELRANN